MTGTTETKKGALRTPPSGSSTLDPSSPGFDVIAWFRREHRPETPEGRRLRLDVLRELRRRQGDPDYRDPDLPANQNISEHYGETEGQRTVRLFHEREERRALPPLWLPAQIEIDGRMIDLSPMYACRDGETIICDRKQGRPFGRRVGSLNKKLGRYQVDRTVNAERQQLYRARILASTFFGLSPEGKPNVCHIDGDPTNDSVSNLRQDDQWGNCQDTIRHGRSCQGERHAQSVVSEAQALEVLKTCVDQGMRISSTEIKRLSAEFGVGIGAIKAIAYGRTWKHLHDQVGFKRPAR